MRNEGTRIHLVLWSDPKNEWVLSCTGGKAIHDNSLVASQVLSCDTCLVEAHRLGLIRDRDIEEVAVESNQEGDGAL
jgi:hypothetical protein